MKTKTPKAPPVAPATGSASPTLEDVVKAAHESGAKVRVELVPKGTAETMIRRAIEIQHTIEHGLDHELSTQATQIMVRATIVTLLQAIGELRR